MIRSHSRKDRHWKLVNHLKNLDSNYALEGDSNMITCSWKDLSKFIKVGSKVLIADGTLTCEVTEVKAPVKLSFTPRKKS